MSTANLRKLPSTIDELIGSSREGWFELVEGALERVHMSPFTSFVGARLLAQLSRYCDETGRGIVFDAETYYHCFPSPKTARKADGSVVLKERLHADWQSAGFLRIAPDLAYEVISPRDNANQVQRKIREYRQAGVRLLWVIYPQTRVAVVYSSRGYEEVEENGELTGQDVLPGFRVRLGDLFPARQPPASEPPVPT
jgi:Uma2 family endonuclease